MEMYVAGAGTRSRGAVRKAWDIAATVVDAEIPVLTIADLGILRDLRVTEEHNAADGGLVPPVQVTITPTYSGCPAMDAIRDDPQRPSPRLATPASMWTWSWPPRGLLTG